jgi:hypothetical protein
MINYVPLKFRIYTFINSILNNFLDSAKAMKYRIDNLGYEAFWAFSEEVKGSHLILLFGIPASIDQSL